MIEWIAVIILGIVEGVTEFLPVSSTGHLLLTEHLFNRTFGLAQRSDVFNTVIQCGAVLAVLLLFTDRAKQLIFERRKPAARQFLCKLLVAFLITGVGGLAMKKANIQLPETASPVAWATLVGGFVIFASERWVKGRIPQEDVSWASAVVVGFAQLLAAVFPGTSRSAATILAAMVVGTARPAATEFSFLVGIPTLLSAGALQIFSSLHDGSGQTGATPENWAHLIVAALVAAATAFLVVKWLLRFVRSHTFVAFGWYRIALGALILVMMG
jgi:undecaprenyl-diphosphatase